MSNNASWLEIRPLGGADTVTGSCYLLTATIGREKKNYMIDCGMFTESKMCYNNSNIEEAVKNVQAIFITHAHLDHIGRLPLAYKFGYRNPIYITKPARALAAIILADSAKIQEQEFLNNLKRAKIKDSKLIKEMAIEPLYTSHDAEAVMEQFIAIDKGQKIRIDENLEVCFYNAGHMLGSASIMMTFNNGEETYRLFFSGDLGQNNPLLKRRVDSPKENVDFVVMESTYAGRYHPNRMEKWSELRKLIAKAIIEGGNVIFPTFAVGRTQEMLYLYYKDMTENNDAIAEILRNVPVYVDSTMAVTATGQFARFPEELNKNAKLMMENSDGGPFGFRHLTMISDAEMSKELTQSRNHYVVFSAAGMCNAGRVRYHLAKDLENPKSVIIFTGYQAEGTLGRELLKGVKTVKISGDPISVRAEIASFNAFSAHIDQNGMVKWLQKINPGYTLFLAHGEPDKQKELRKELDELGVVKREKSTTFEVGKVYTLYKGGYNVRTEKDQREEKKEQVEDIKKRIEGIKRAKDIVQLLPKMYLDSETLHLIGALENRLNHQHTRAKKLAKSQSKPNRRNTGRGFKR